MATKTVSIVTGGTNSASTTAAEINALATDFIANGVVGAVSLNAGSGGTGSFAINAQGTPAMSIRVSAGQAYQTGSPTGGTSQRVRVSMDTFEDVTIAANSTGGTRYDWVYIKLDPDKLLNPGANKDDVATLVTSRSTSSSTDNGTPPTYGYNLGYVTVANGASSIANSNITDSRVQTGTNRVATNGVATASITNASVTADKLATGAATAYVATGETTTSTSFTDLTTPGPAVTATIGANGMALVIISNQSSNNTINKHAKMAVAVSGATTVAAPAGNFQIDYSMPGTDEFGLSAAGLITGLTPGSNTFTAKYAATAGTASFNTRRITVVPL